ncbi:MAG: MobF family relaxase [Phycisphaerales bacterium]
MLRITPSANAARARSYYSTADYYTEGQELTGLWRGEGSARLGLRGVIDQKDWDRLCDNRRPDTCGPLTARLKSERRVGYDVNFHCPKGVSLLYGLTRDERLLDAFRSSVRSTMDEIEVEAKGRVRTKGRNEDRVTGNLVMGEFVHFTARPEDGVPDPHLHAHCFVFNATYDSEESRWKALQFGDAKRDAPYFEAVFHATLARQLEGLGLETVRTRTGWDLAELSPSTIAKFSRRTARIEREAKDRGITDPVAKAELGARTRAAKTKELGMAELEGVWRSRLTPDESMSLGTLANHIGSRSLHEDHTVARESARRALDHVFERTSVVPERSLLTSALRQGVGKASRETVERRTLAQPLIHATRDGRRMVTTRDVLEEEKCLLAFAREGRGACRPLAPNRARVQREWLNEQQKRAVCHVLESKDRVMLVRGVAGAGKTSTLAEIRDALQEANVPIVACAPSSGAARGVLRQEGFESADTLAMLLANPNLQSHAEHGLILVDEAGLVGTKAMRRLFDVARERHARVLLVGDTRQHHAVERGSPIQLLGTEAGVASAEIKEIQRQKAQYKAAVRDLSNGHVRDAINRLDTLGWVKEIDDESRSQVLAEAYVDAVGAGKSAIIVSPTHAEGDAVTHAIRARLREKGLLGSDAREVPRLVPLHLTLGEKRDPVNYEPGDVLVYHQNAKGHTNGERVVVGDRPVPLDQVERFTVFRQERLELTPGDKIRITRNGRTLDGDHRVNNGDVYTLRSFTPEGDLVLNNGWTLARDFGHLAHGLVTTSHASQGKTVDVVLIAQSEASFSASSKEQFYVSVSRGREKAVVFTDSKADLFRAVSREDERLSGTELLRHAAHEARAREEAHRVMVRARLAEQARAVLVNHDLAREGVAHER